MNELQLSLEQKPVRVWDLAVPIITKDSLTTVFLTSQIDEPSIYDELIYTLSQKRKEDTVKFIINTPGGVLDSAISIISGIRSCKATTIAKVTGSVGSAGTMITTACDKLEVDDHASFMVHTYSTQTAGKGQEVKAQQTFMEKSIKVLMEDIYGEFLTKAELKKLLNGEDFWFNKQQLLARWEKRQKHLEK